MKLYSRMIWDGKNLVVPPEMGEPKSHHLLSTPLDNLIELAGRVCYDSIRIKKSRSSPDYHKHIAEVGHQSVQEHANFTCLVPRKSFDCPERELLLFKSIFNRPGVFFIETEAGYRLTLNIRTAVDWNKHSKCYRSEISEWLGKQLRTIGHQLCPMAMFDVVDSDEKVINLVNSEFEEEIWVSFFLMNVSRAMTHELVRHGEWTAISQRSSRYVDEHDSTWSWHPLIDLWSENGGDTSLLKETEKLAKTAYGKSLIELEEFLKSRGTDKLTARKQSRGAARGVLGNALSTELIFSASLSQWKWIILSRATDAADAEIRVAIVEIFQKLRDRFPDNFKNWSLKSASDGVGLVVVPPEFNCVR